MSPVVLTGGNPPSEEHSLIKDLRDQLSMVRQNLKEMKAKADVALSNSCRAIERENFLFSKLARLNTSLQCKYSNFLK
jgi:hypothetical protein